MKRFVVGVTLTLGVLAGCGKQPTNSQQSKNQKTVPLQFINVKNKDAKTNKDGAFVLKGTTKPGSKVTSLNGKTVIAKNKHFSMKVSLPNNKKWDTIEIDAYHKGYKPNYDFFNLYNNSRAYTRRISAKKAKQAEEDSVNEKQSAKDQRKENETASRHKEKINNEYPTVTSVYGSKRLSSLSSSQLTHNIRLTSKIIDLGADSMDNYHVLLKVDNTYVLMVESSKTTGKLAQGDTITVYGMFNGRSRINENQINTGLGSSYYTEPCVLLMANKVVKQDE